MCDQINVPHSAHTIRESHIAQSRTSRETYI